MLRIPYKPYRIGILPLSRQAPGPNKPLCLKLQMGPLSEAPTAPGSRPCQWRSWRPWQPNRHDVLHL